MHHDHAHNTLLIFLSFAIAMFASYTALDLASSVAAARGRARAAWLLGGSIAMGVGIWSMHFVGMLAFQIPGYTIAYDIPLLITSVIVAIAASALALWIVSRDEVTRSAYIWGSLAMGTAIAGMHYIGIASMRVEMTWEWNYSLVALSVVIAISASFAALHLAFRLRNDFSRSGLIYRGLSGLTMGVAIAGMHYTGMAAMTFNPTVGTCAPKETYVLASSGLALAVIGTTILILILALGGSILDRALARRRADIRARDEFLSVASHELKTPLTSLKLQAQIRIRTLDRRIADAFTPEKLRRMFEDDARQIERLAGLIDNMLDISKINTGKLLLSRESCDLREIAHEVIIRHSTQIETAGCKVTFQADDSVLGYWDRFRIEQVLTNLLTNALKYGARNPIQVRIKSSGDRSATITVQDQGMGIAVEDQGRIFNRFERAVSANEISGLGLGLYIVREIVEMHAGKVGVESELGKGATFVVTLPQDPPRA